MWIGGLFVVVYKQHYLNEFVYKFWEEVELGASHMLRTEIINMQTMTFCEYM